MTSCVRPGWSVMSCLRTSTKPFPSGRAKAVPPWGGGGGSMGLDESQPAREEARRKTADRDARVMGPDFLESERRREAGRWASLPGAWIVELMERPQ
jgi:hypothetical protein